jgi:hypothetical protein
MMKDSKTRGRTMIKGWIALLFFFTVGLHAQENNCKSIQDYDKMRYCYATETGQKSFCYTIGDSDLKNLCMAQLKNQKTPCYKIFSTEMQNQCLKSIK